MNTLDLEVASPMSCRALRQTKQTGMYTRRHILFVKQESETE